MTLTHQRNVTTILKEQKVLPGDEMIRLLDTMTETEAGLFKRMFKNGLFELMGTDGAFEFGLKLILSGIEQVIKEQEK
ncbi:tetracycline repressor-like protein [Cohnella sp. SGD-V74]|nr:tetracycline repressor-like protein [Cohnella sp. SGD-V74]